MQSQSTSGVAATPPWMPLALTRRVALALPLAAVAACSSPTSSSSSSLSQASSASAEDEARLIAQYDSAIALFPQLQAQLGPIRDEHRAHLAALGGAHETGQGAATPSTTSSTSQQAIADLANAEKAASVQRLNDCVAAPDAQVARTLALIAASEAGHVSALLGS